MFKDGGVSRREFVKRLGGVALASSMPISMATFFSCQSAPKEASMRADFPFSPLPPNNLDQVTLAEGLRYATLVKWNDRINRFGDRFGFNNDYTAFLNPAPSARSSTFWVNHEYADEMFVSNYQGGKKTRDQVVAEMKSVGGSILRLKRRTRKDSWRVDIDSKYSQRVDAFTKTKVVGAKGRLRNQIAVGTFGNCAGGVTPWGTVLTCEEGYEEGFGYLDDNDIKRRKILRADDDFNWDLYFDHPPEHYGWVVEVNPRTKNLQKLVGLGRFAHECATVARSQKTGNIVVYSGDDKRNECLYKFVSNSPASIVDGTLYVANLEKKMWIPVSLHAQPKLEKYFSDPDEVMIRTRFAAKIVGGSPLDRPEDIEIHPETGDVFLTLTENKYKKNYFGSVMKLMQEDHASLEFDFETFVPGGEESGIACPDNLGFDPQGNLWLTTDVSGSILGRTPYASFMNNSLFFILMQGPHAGKPFRAATAPVNAEFTGISFSGDGRTLFLSVQHPGEKSKSLANLKSHWPEGGDSLPKPAVIQIEGPLLEKISSV